MYGCDYYQIVKWLQISMIPR